MIETLLMAGGAGGVATLILLANAQRQAAADKRVWETAARVLDGACALPSGLARITMTGQRVLSATASDTSVVVTCTDGKNASTKAVATFGGAQALVIAVIAEGGLTSLGKRVGVVHDEEQGDRVFDARFVVTSNDAALCRAWLSLELRSMILAPALSDWELSVEHGAIELARAGQPGTHDELVRAVRLAGALAARSRELRAEWEALAAALGGALADGDHELPFVPIRVRRGKVSLEIAVVRKTEGSTTCIRAEKDGAAAEPLALELGRLTLDAEVVDAALTLVVEQLGAAEAPYRH